MRIRVYRCAYSLRDRLRYILLKALKYTDLGLYYACAAKDVVVHYTAWRRNCISDSWLSCNGRADPTFYLVFVMVYYYRTLCL